MRWCERDVSEFKMINEGEKWNVSNEEKILVFLNHKQQTKMNKWMSHMLDNDTRRKRTKFIFTNLYNICWFINIYLFAMKIICQIISRKCQISSLEGKLQIFEYISDLISPFCCYSLQSKFWIDEIKSNKMQEKLFLER